MWCIVYFLPIFVEAVSENSIERQVKSMTSEKMQDETILPKDKQVTEKASNRTPFAGKGKLFGVKLTLIIYHT